MSARRKAVAGIALLAAVAGVLLLIQDRDSQIQSRPPEPERSESPAPLPGSPAEPPPGPVPSDPLPAAIPAAPEAVPPGAILAVRVEDQRGRPVSSAQVSLHPRASRDQAARSRVPWQFQQEELQKAVFSGRTDSTGRVEIEAIPTGAWTVHVEARGFVPATSQVSLHGAERPPEVAFTLLPATTLTGVVRLRDGTILAGVTVESEIVTLGRPVEKLTARTNEEGMYRFDGLPRARVAISVRVSDALVVTAGTVDAARLEVYDITLDLPAAVSGRVIEDLSGKPVAGARVHVTLLNAGGAGDAAARAETAEDGSFSLAPLPASCLLAVTANADGFLAATRSFPPGTEPLSEKTPFALELRLRRGATVRGTVRFGSGEPVAGASVRLMGQGWSHEAERTLRGTTDEEGRFLFPCVPQGVARIRVTGPGFFQPEGNQSFRYEVLPEALKLLVPASGEVSKDVLVMRGGTVEGVVRSPDGRPLAGIMVNVRPHGGLTVTTDDTGAFRVDGVPPGEGLFASAWGNRGESGRSAPFDLTASDPLRGVEVELVPGAVIAGAIRCANGPLPDVLVLRLGHAVDPRSGSLLESNRRQGRPVPVAVDGTFRIEGLTPRPYTLLCSAAGCGEVAVPVPKLSPGEVREGVAVVMEAELAIAGRVERTDGASTEGTPIHVLPWPEKAETLGQSSLGPVRTLADGAGRFEVRGLAAGRYRVTAGVPGMIDVTELVEAGTPDLHFMVSPALWITGVVLDHDSGRPIPEIGVVANYVHRTPRHPMRTVKSRSGPDGGFELGPLYRGSYHLYFASATDAGPEYELHAIDAEAGEEGLEVRLRRALAINGRVLDANRRPLSEIAVSISRAGARGNDRTAYPRGIRTGQDGTFVVGHLPAGRYDLRFSDRSGRGLIETWSKGVPAGTGDLVVSMKSGMAISGRIVGPNGGTPKGRGRLRVSVSGEKTATSARVEADGSFRTDPLESGRTYDLLAYDFEGNHTGVLRSVAPGATEVRIVLERGGVVTGRVELVGGGAAPEGVLVTAYGTGKTASGELPGRRISTKTRVDGTFVLEGLGDDSYHIMAGGAGQPYEPVPSPETSGVRPGRTGLVLRVRECATLSGRIVDPDGRPVPCVVTYRQDRRGGYMQSGVRTDKDGNFTIRTLAPGKVRLSTTVGSRKVDLGTHVAPAEGLVIVVR